MRRGIIHLPKTLAMLACILLLAGAARADKIVLKNGRKIIAYNVVEDGDKIRYETPAGQMALPKSIVDHIEKGGILPLMGSPAAAAANLNLEPAEPAATAVDFEIDKGAVHDGSVDRNYINELETGAATGSAKAIKAARAHHAAARFEMFKGDLEHALADARAAVFYAPEEPAMLLELAYVYLRRSEFKQSLESLERAKRYAPNNPDVYKLEGWTYYGLNRPDQAAAEWKKSLALRADREVQAALDKATRDTAEEENYRENESAHFQLKYNGAAEPGLAREVLHTLEGHYQQIESELNFSPPDPIGVVLYTQEGFADITRAPGWAGALNDGRIRVPVRGLSGVDSELSRVLRHELTHSFIQQKTHSRAPTWIQEGVAQWMEGKRSDESAAVLLQVYDAGQAAPLGQLEGSWMRLPGPMASYAYAWALANIEYIVQTQGMGDVERMLDRLATGTATEQALREVLHDDYADLMQATAEYLKKNYGR
jgi:tetratricopeptide (TPR) repeat protein